MRDLRQEYIDALAEALEAGLIGWDDYRAELHKLGV